MPNFRPGLRIAVLVSQVPKPYAQSIDLLARPFNL